jgi:hypothetical protein
MAAGLEPTRMMKRIALTIAAALLVCGVGLLMYASILSPYADELEFNRRYLQLAVGQNAEFHALLKEYLTAKYDLLDYGLTLIVLAGVAWLVARFGQGGIKSPPTRQLLARLAQLAAFLLSFALVFTVVQSYARGFYPRWADSIGPLVAAGVVVWLLAAGWAFAHLRLLPREYPGAQPLQLAISGKMNPWLMLLALASMGLAVLGASQGAWQFLAAGLLWCYVYFSIAAARRAAQPR